MTFFGTQPTLTQVPPSAPFSQTATFAPAERGVIAAMAS